MVDETLVKEEIVDTVDDSRDDGLDSGMDYGAIFWGGPSGMKGWLTGSDLSGGFSSMDGYGGEGSRQDMRPPLPAQQPQGHQLVGDFVDSFGGQLNFRTPNTPKKIHQCPVCPYTTPNRSHWIVHCRTHTGEKPYSCSYCPYEAVAKSDLKRHIRIHTGEKPFSCPHCPYQTAVSASLKRHILTHLQENSLVTMRLEASRRHSWQGVRTEGMPLSSATATITTTSVAGTSIKIHQCPYCAYTTSIISNLKKHARIHTGEKPFACPHCPFRATQMENLRKHVRTHTGEKPYTCQQCMYRTTKKSCLMRHIMTVHNV
ncbi:zinc finger protein 513-like [Penaeus monodon]|uniref:zinc finger protein 513-like n=1 Tax=Penaeus monodon TaxID=6687 RepID=UPI0018A76464|nr:zinc finger protein 513-like [Penaeus monodon]